MLKFLGLLAFAYLFGAIPFALIIARVTKGIDIRKVGSGNVGATNVMRSCGIKPGLLCFVCDFTKGFVPVIIAVSTITQPLDMGVELSVALQLLLICVASVIGHCFPVYLMTLGGKGIATSLGVFAGLMPWPTAICFVVGVTIIGTTGYVALASCLGATALPILAWLFHYNIEFIVTTAILAVVIDMRHLGNIKRLLKGVEPKVWDKAKIPDVDHGIEKE